MKLTEAQKLRIKHVHRDYSSWSTDELKQEYNRIGQELLLREQPSPEEQYPRDGQHAVNRFFDRRVPIQHAIWREERNLIRRENE